MMIRAIPWTMRWGWLFIIPMGLLMAQGCAKPPQSSDAKFQEATRLLQSPKGGRASYHQARAILEGLLAEDPAYARPDAVLYFIGMTWQYQADAVYTEAEAVFRKVIDEYPKSEYAPKALIHIGECHEYNLELVDYTGALAAYREAVEKYPDTLDGEREGLDRIARICTLQTQDYAAGARAYEALLTKYRETYTKSIDVMDREYQLGKIYLQGLGDLDKAETFFKDMEERYRRTVYWDRILDRLEEIEKRRQDFPSSATEPAELKEEGAG